MRVLIFHPHLDVKGGSERLTKILYEGLKDLGVQAHLVSFAATGDWFPDVITAPEPAEVVRIADKIRPDWIFLTISETSYAKGLRDKARIAMYVHFPLEEEAEEENIHEYEKRGRFLLCYPEELKLIDRIFVNSRRTAMAVRLVWGRESIVAHPPLEKRFFADDSPVRAFPPPVILSTGRFTPLKRQDFLIFALDRIREDIPEAELVLAGFPDPRHEEYYREIKNMAEETEGVRIVESPSDEELFNLYGTARVYAHPRIGEHFGISPCEAMARGVPAVVRYPTGLKDIANQFIARSDYAFIRMLTEVLKMTPSEWFKVNDKVRKSVSPLTPDNFVRTILGGLK
ncbi:glycosyltransferase family 4 protein [Thermodesulforhabdus norvegica]|uniref:Glycosyl transferases group 1 n=1 Tax=Thermodesulforhabdus norvegica TaxID=39841 RepID=A0A1I4TZ73_9BACT|nr:glycosyltransferase family 4 protein [Thermodesulforhabdus norvegica]SFM81937.1 Glycosyl transferases group 1 [Thermodesulforhabdus norvegica]